MTSATANRAAIALNGSRRFNLGPGDQELSQRESDECAEHVGREDSPPLRWLSLSVEPALGGDKESRATEADHRAQGQPRQRSDKQRHEGSRGDDQPCEGGIGADMPDSLDDPLAAQCAKREAGEIAAEDETGHGWPEVLDRHTQGDEGAEEAVGELDQARRDDQRPDLRPHRQVFRSVGTAHVILPAFSHGRPDRHRMES